MALRGPSFSRDFKAVYLFLFLFSTAIGYAQERERHSDSLVVKLRYHIAWIDTSGTRAFVVVEKSVMSSRSSAIALAKNVRSEITRLVARREGEMRQRLDISFFSDRKYATYKDSVALSEISKWQAAYLAEYTANNRHLKLFPLDPKRVRVFLLK